MSFDESGRRRLLVEAGQLVDEEITARDIEEAGIETVRIRSVLTCEAKRGLLPDATAGQPGQTSGNGRYRRGRWHYRGSAPIGELQARSSTLRTFHIECNGGSYRRADVAEVEGGRRRRVWRSVGRRDERRRTRRS